MVEMCEEYTDFWEDSGSNPDSIMLWHWVTSQSHHSWAPYKIGIKLPIVYVTLLLWDINNLTYENNSVSFSIRAPQYRQLFKLTFLSYVLY